MKRCPKCNRSYPDDNQKFCTLDGSSLVSADQGFDPNATILSTSNLANQPPPQAPPVDLNRTVASPAPPAGPGRSTPSSGSNATELLNPNTGPMSGATVVDRPAPVSPPPAQSARLPQPPPPAPPASSPAKKSKAPLIIGGLLLLLVLGVGAIAAAYFMLIRPRLESAEPQREVLVNSSDTNPTANDNANVTTEPVTEKAYVAPPGTVRFTNSLADVDQKLSEHYVDFSFYYPETWKVTPQRDVFVNLEKTEEDDKGVYVVENANISWYNSRGTFEADVTVFPDRVRSLEAQIAPRYPGYRKLSEGETTVNSHQAYEFRFTGIGDTGKGDLPYWGRVIFIPPGEGKAKGVVITLLATGLSKDITAADHVGQKGDAAIILDSFRFGKDN